MRLGETSTKLLTRLSRITKGDEMEKYLELMRELYELYRTRGKEADIDNVLELLDIAHGELSTEELLEVDEKLIELKAKIEEVLG